MSSPSIPLHSTPPYRQRGSSLLEVLIAVLVLAIGMLGLAALAAVTLKNSNSAAARSHAMVHVYSMFDHLRLERDLAQSGSLDEEWTSSGDSVMFNSWLADVQTSLGDPGAAGLVSCDVTECTVGISWDDRSGTGEFGGGAEGDRLQLVLTSRL